MEKLFERQHTRKGRTISSLRYLRAAVEAAWEEMLALKAGGRAEEAVALPVESRLANLAASSAFGAAAAVQLGGGARGPCRSGWFAERGRRGAPHASIPSSCGRCGRSSLGVTATALFEQAAQVDQALARLRGRLAEDDLVLARAARDGAVAAPPIRRSGAVVVLSRGAWAGRYAGFRARFRARFRRLNPSSQGVKPAHAPAAVPALVYLVAVFAEGLLLPTAVGWLAVGVGLSVALAGRSGGRFTVLFLGLLTARVAPTPDLAGLDPGRPVEAAGGSPATGAKNRAEPARLCDSSSCVKGRGSGRHHRRRGWSFASAARSRLQAAAYGCAATCRARPGSPTPTRFRPEASACASSRLGCWRSSSRRRWRAGHSPAGGRRSRGRSPRRCPPSRRGLCTGTLLGDLESISASERLAFRRSGLAHLLAVSGMNVALVAGVAAALGSFCSRRCSPGSRRLRRSCRISPWSGRCRRCSGRHS